ncbi:hypothetical protein [Acinetobacter pecorum]|nr:hypothetical protein [Acinetobacter pecorum]
MTSQNALDQFYQIVRVQPVRMKILQTLALLHPHAYIAADDYLM